MSFQNAMREHFRGITNANADVQRQKTLTKEERGRDAIDRMTGAIVESNRQAGRDVSPDSVRSELVKVAEKTDRERG